MALSPTEAKEFSERKLRREYLESQRVVVHIWTSGFNIDRRGVTIGHVAITHPSAIPSEYFYLSLWPTDEGKERGYGITSAIEREFKPNLQADIDEEERPPEFTLCFYTLDVDKIRKAYNEACATTKGWSVTGLAFCGNADSCVSSVWKLLLAGNIRKLISHLEQSSASAAGSSQGASLSRRDGSSYASEMVISPIIKSPDAVAKFLAKAKQKELEREPLTRELRFAGERVSVDGVSGGKKYEIVSETPIRDLPQDKWQDKCLDKTLFCYNYLKGHPGATVLGLGIASAGLAWASGHTPELPEAISKTISDSCKIM